MENSIDLNLIAVTSDNNLLYFDLMSSQLKLWSMESRRVILTSSCNEDVNKVYSTKRNKNYWIGYLGGILE